MSEKKDLWKNKKMYGQFVREIPETTDEREKLKQKPCCVLHKSKQFEQTM